MGNSSFAAVLMLESVEDGVHKGIASLILQGGARFSQIKVCDTKDENMTVFRQWTTEEATLHSDSIRAVESSLGQLHPHATRVCCSVFASPDDTALCAMGCVASVPSASYGCEDVQVHVKIFGSPCSWAQIQEEERLRGVVQYLQHRYGRPVFLTSLGPTRLRLSQCLWSPDGLRVLSPPTTHHHQARRIPRCHFILRFPAWRLDDERLVRLVHHFIVETMFTERRRDIPRHHVTVVALDDVSGCVTAKDVEELRSTLRRELINGEMKKNRVLGVTFATWAPHWRRLLQLPAREAPNRSIKLEASFLLLDGGEEGFARFTAAVVQWELDCLSSKRE